MENLCGMKAIYFILRRFIIDFFGFKSDLGMHTNLSLKMQVGEMTLGPLQYVYVLWYLRASPSILKLLICGHQLFLVIPPVHTPQIEGGIVYNSFSGLNVACQMSQPSSCLKKFFDYEVRSGDSVQFKNML